MATHSNKGFTTRLRRTVRTFICNIPGCGKEEESVQDFEILRDKTFKRYGVRALICRDHFERGNFDWVDLEIEMMRRLADGNGTK